MTEGLTQQHLADACAVSLRTIQRVEKEGMASSETVLALCSVLEVERKTIESSHTTHETFPPGNRLSGPQAGLMRYPC